MLEYLLERDKMDTKDIPNLGRMIHAGEFTYLHEAVLEAKPKLVIESGTFLGTGSTLAIATALLKMTRGILWTYELNEIFYKKAVDFYTSKFENFGFIKFYNMNFVDAVKRFDYPTYRMIDFVFLDGGDEDFDGAIKDIKAEDSENLLSFQLMESKLHIGTHVLLHDWNFGRGLFIQNYLRGKDFRGWCIKEQFNDHNGFVHLIKGVDARGYIGESS
jgi:hypothetical protein